MKLWSYRYIVHFFMGEVTRPIEFDAYGVDREKRAAYYREALYVMREVWSTSFPMIHSARVSLTGETDVLPKPVLGNIPTFVTGFSGQSIEWIAEHGDGWLTYPWHLILQEKFINDYRLLANGFKPFSSINLMRKVKNEMK